MGDPSYTLWTEVIFIKAQMIFDRDLAARRGVWGVFLNMLFGWAARCTQELQTPPKPGTSFKVSKHLAFALDILVSH